MFGFSFLKAQATDYVLAFSNGKLHKQGLGLAFWYFAPTTSIALVPTASVSAPFIFTLMTADFQEVSVQGQIAYRAAEPQKTAELLNFTIGPKGAFLTQDPEKLPQRVIDQVQVAMRAEVQAQTLKQALAGNQDTVANVAQTVRAHSSIIALGVELMGLNVLAVRPKPETAKALEAEAREALLGQADQAIFVRRNSAVENERKIKESEFETQIAIENKKRQVQEAQLDAERSAQDRRMQMRAEAMTGDIAREEQNKALVALASANARQESEAKAHGVSTMMQAFNGADPKVLQALASVGMDSGKLMALAFRDIADNAQKIGQLTLTPDLLSEIIKPRPGA